MVIGFSLRCTDTPIAVVADDGNETVFETKEVTPSSAIADTVIVTVSDDNTARVFVLNSNEITS